MYRLNASVVLNDRFDKNGNPLQCPVTLNQILLRGCNVRNTKWVIGVVLMTGWDTKIIANSGVTPSKRSQVEKQMNPMVYFNLWSWHAFRSRARDRRFAPRAVLL